MLKMLSLKPPLEFVSFPFLTEQSGWRCQGPSDGYHTHHSSLCQNEGFGRVILSVRQYTKSSSIIYVKMYYKKVKYKKKNLEPPLKSASK